MSERASTKGRERPILFSAPMVRALLAGTKTQTRRILKPQPETVPGRVSGPHQDCETGKWGMVHTAWRYSETLGNYEPDREEMAPFRMHAVGDRLWVREAWRPNWGAEGYREDLGRVARPADFDPKRTAIEYLADDTHELNGKNRPGIHMPRWASRLTLTVTDVRVQRLHDISEEDARAEGVEPIVDHGVGTRHLHRIAFDQLWDRIHGAGATYANTRRQPPRGREAS